VILKIDIGSHEGLPDAVEVRMAVETWRPVRRELPLCWRRLLAGQRGRRDTDQNEQRSEEPRPTHRTPTLVPILIAFAGTELSNGGFDLLFSLLETALSANHEIGARGLLTGRHLRGEPLACLVNSQTAPDEALDLDFRRAERDDDAIEVRRVPGF